MLYVDIEEPKGPLKCCFCARPLILDEYWYLTCPKNHIMMIINGDNSIVNINTGNYIINIQYPDKYKFYKRLKKRVAAPFSVVSEEPLMTIEQIDYVEYYNYSIKQLDNKIKTIITFS